MNDPYNRNLIKNDFYYQKVDIKGRVIVVLDGKLDNRELNLIKPPSRAFAKYSVIELIATDESDAKPGSVVNKIAYLCFVEITDAGVVLAGDEVFIGGKKIGVISGYDDTHSPNHQNTIIYMTERSSGKDLKIKLNDEVIIKGIYK